MRKQASRRPLMELYDPTVRISEPEGAHPAEKRYTYGKFCTRAESRTCNVCSAPCPSCMHLNRTVSVMESKIECLFSGSTFRRKEADSCSFVGVDGVPFYKSRTCDDHQHAASETSNLVSASSSHDSYTENAESKVTMRTSATYDASDAVDMSSKMSSSAAIGDDQILPKKTDVAAHNLFSSYSHRTFLSRAEEQRGSECHGDNISCITGVRNSNFTILAHNADLDKKDATCSSASTSSLCAKRLEDVPVEAAHALNNSEIEENQSNFRRPDTYQKGSLRKKIGCCSSTMAGLSDKTEFAEFPPSRNLHSSKVQSSCFHSQEGHYFHDNANSKDLNGNSSSQFQVSRECSTENVESSLGPHVAAGSVDEQKRTAHPNYEDSKSSYIRSGNSSVVLKDTVPCLKTEIGTGSGTLKKQLENSSFMEAYNRQEPHVQPQLTMESESFESDSGLIDVKICDICGDAGREELLAICSRCSDGAEHIYCMKKMLDKLPEGNWLCEECKDQKADKSEMVSGKSKLTCLNENSQNFVSTSLPKLDIEVIDAEATGAIKGLQSQQISTTRHADNLVSSSITSKKVSEASGGFTGTASPRKKTLLSCDSSFKNLDRDKIKPVNTGPSFGSQSANHSPAMPRLQTSLSSSSLKVQTQLQSPRVPVSRSNSFNTSNFKPSPKVKQLIENVPYKLKMARKSASGDTRKDGLFRTITKSSSFKRVTSGRSIIDSVGKTQSLNTSRGEDPSGSKQVKLRNGIEKKNSSVLDLPLTSSSPAASTSVPLPKADLKVAQHDGKLNNTFKSKSLGISKKSDDADVIGRKEVMKQSSYLSNRFESRSSNGMCNIEDRNPCQVPKEGVRTNSAASDRSCSKGDTVLQRGVAQGAKSTLSDDKTNESTIFSTSKQAASGGNQILHCQICNETGHATQSCSVDKLRNCVLKTSEERNLREGNKKSKKWKDVVEATNSKIRIQKNNKLPDQSDKSSMPSANLSCGVTSKDLLSSSSSCPRDLPFLEGTKTDDEEISRSSGAEPSNTAAVIDIRQHTMHPAEASYLTTASDLTFTVSDQSNVTPSMQILPDQASIHAKSSRTSAIPELQFIWKGGFEVLRTSKLPEVFDGMQAHLSTCASRKVLEVVTKFPCKVLFEEVPCISSWPMQFQGSNAKEDNIALFFFAKDIESYKKSYLKLLESMLTNDLALRGNIVGVELLVFPSNKLPVNSQRWNGLFFLWGVFRRRTNCLEALPGSRKKPCGSILSTDPLVQDFSLPLTIDASNSQKIDSCQNRMELSRCDRPSKVKAVMSTTSVDYWPISSSGMDDRTSNIEASPLVGNSFYQTAADSILPSENTSISFPASCSLKMMNQLPTCHESKLQLSAKMLCQEGNMEDTYLKNLRTDYEGGKVHPNNLQMPAYGGSEGGRNEEEAREKEKKMRSEANTLEDGEMNHLSWEPRPDSCLVESHESSETSKSHDETDPEWKESSNCLSIEDGREHKKMKPCIAGGSFRIENSSGRWWSSSSSEQQQQQQQQQQHRDVQRAMPESSSCRAERFFFQVELGPLRDDSPSLPNLELALGGVKKKKKSALPLLFRPATIKEDDDVSLSLGFPSPPDKLLRLKEEILPDSPGVVDTSLFLFSGFPD